MPCADRRDITRGQHLRHLVSLGVADGDIAFLHAGFLQTIQQQEVFDQTLLDGDFLARGFNQYRIALGANVGATSSREPGPLPRDMARLWAPNAKRRAEVIPKSGLHPRRRRAPESQLRLARVEGTAYRVQSEVETTAS